MDDPSEAPIPPPQWDAMKALDKDAFRDLFIKGLTLVLTSGQAKASDFEVARKILVDPSFTFDSVRRGDFKDLSERVFEEFPVGDDGEVRFQ